MKSKLLLTLLSLIIVLTAISGCQKTETLQTQDNTGNTESTISGQVTAIDGNTITLALGTENEPMQQGQQKTDDENKANTNEPPAKPDNDGDAQANAGTPPTGDTNGEVPKLSENQGETPNAPPNGNMSKGGITLTGEEKTITVSDNTVITIDNIGESQTGSITDITVGNIITVTISGDEVTAITVKQAPENMNPANTPTNETEEDTNKTSATES